VISWPACESNRSSLRAGTRRRPTRWLTWLVFPLIAACGIGIEKDGAPDSLVDVSQAKEPVPRSEPPSRYGNPPSYVVHGRRYYTLASSRNYRERGIASWYGRKFHGRQTSSREVYDMYALTAAHKTLPLPTYARVTNLENGRQVVVRVNDRGPFHSNRIIDLSYAAAKRLGILARGTGLVEVEAIDPVKPVSDRPAMAKTLSPEAVDMYLQVGAFANRDNALRLQQRVSSVAKAPVLISEVVDDRAALYRVRLGPLADVDEADRLVERLAQLGIRDSHVILE
jgi:rare lipoprotein A